MNRRRTGRQRSADAALAIEKLLEKQDCPNRVMLSDILPTPQTRKRPQRHADGDGGRAHH